MRRTVALAAVLALAILLPGGQSAAPHARSAQAEKNAGVGKTSPTVWRGEEFAEKLQRTVDFSGIDDPKTMFIEALDQFAKLFHLNFNVNERAFAYDNLNDVLKTHIADVQPIPPMRATLHTVLTKVLSRIPVPTGATYMVRKDHIEITTGRFQAEEVWKRGYRPAYLAPDSPEAQHEGPTFPLVHGSFVNRSLEDVLQELADRSDCNVILDPAVGEKKGSATVKARFLNLPLDAAVLLVSDMAGLQPVLIDNALYVTTPDKAARLAKAHATMRPMKKPKEKVEEKAKPPAEEKPAEKKK